jgi:hypothetical protein
MDNLNEKRESCLKVLLNTHRFSVAKYQKTFVPFGLKFGLAMGTKNIMMTEWSSVLKHVNIEIRQDIAMGVKKGRKGPDKEVGCILCNTPL